MKEKYIKKIQLQKKQKLASIYKKKIEKFQVKLSFKGKIKIEMLAV